MSAIQPGSYILRSGLFTSFVHAYGKIRAVQFAPPAPGAPVRINLGRSAIIVEHNAFLRAERRANAAGFAPIAKDVYLEALAVLWFRASGRNRFSFFGLAGAPGFAPQGFLTLLLIAFHIVLEILILVRPYL
jgi:hypothetical protein